MYIMSPLKSILGRKTPLGKVNLHGEQSLREIFSFSVVWLVAESEVLALSCVKHGSTVRTWIGRVPRSKERCSGMASPSLIRGLFEY